ncbi:MAG: hypothetical protein MJE68_15680 [Proteobacteria bacterium]|nr:hypothetical protein [Pseudomonadota bacterium]
MKITNTFTPKTDTNMLRGQSNTAIIASVVSTVGLLILSSALIIAAVVITRNYRRRSAKQKLDNDAPYSTLSLNRGSGLQVQPQSTQQNSNELYDQIHLSPSTGQTEFIPKSQSENTNNPHYSTHATHPDTENPVTNESAASQTNSPMTTYAAIDKGNKKKAKKDDTKHSAAENYTFGLGVHAEGKDNSMKRSQISLDDMYALDHQDQQERVNNDQESNPSNSIEELYTAVQKKPKGSSAPVNESVPQMAEDLYTTVMKKPKENSANDEVVPPIPPHTVEELYTAVHKKPLGNAMVREDEEKAPPIPPFTVEDTF